MQEGLPCKTGRIQGLVAKSPDLDLGTFTMRTGLQATDSGSRATVALAWHGVGADWASTVNDMWGQAQRE